MRLLYSLDNKTNLLTKFATTGKEKKTDVFLMLAATLFYEDQKFLPFENTQERCTMSTLQS